MLSDITNDVVLLILHLLPLDSLLNIRRSSRRMLILSKLISSIDNMSIWLDTKYVDMPKFKSPHSLGKLFPNLIEYKGIVSSFNMANTEPIVTLPKKLSRLTIGIKTSVVAPFEMVGLLDMYKPSMSYFHVSDLDNFIIVDNGRCVTNLNMPCNIFNVPELKSIEFKWRNIYSELTENNLGLMKVAQSIFNGDLKVHLPRRDTIDMRFFINHRLETMSRYKTGDMSITFVVDVSSVIICDNMTLNTPSFTVNSGFGILTISIERMKIPTARKLFKNAMLSSMDEL